MFLTMYESRKVPFADGPLYISRTPIGYQCVDDSYEPGCIVGEGDTVLAAIADYNEQQNDR